MGEWGKGDGSTDGTVTGMKHDSGKEGGGPGGRRTADAAAAVASCEGAHIDIDQRHTSSGIEDPSIPVGDLGVVTSKQITAFP